MSFSAQGVLVYVATRDDTPAPIKDYYQKAMDWDADAATLAASRQLGWQVAMSVPGGEQYQVASVRPVDIVVRDRQGAPVPGLSGRLLTMRPADTRLNGSSTLTELPHQPGHYRTLARLPVPGWWQFNIDTKQGTTRFVTSQRMMVDGGGR